MLLAYKFKIKIPVYSSFEYILGMKSELTQKIN